MSLPLQQWLDRWWKPLLCIGVALHLSTLWGSLTEPDSALYGTIGKHMAETGDLVDLIAYRGDWLDKPHFSFWLTAVSMRIFGVNVVAYRLPGVALFLLGVFYTWKLGKLLFDETVARLAVLLLLAAENTLLSNSDLRLEPFLVGLIVAAVFHFLRGTTVNPHPDPLPKGEGDMVAGAFFTAAAMMTKGPFVIVPIGGALLALGWRELLRPRWFLAAALTFVFLTPVLAALYLQFDAHPEKVIYDRTGVSGIRFFFWDSQFGRFLNTGPLKGYGDPSYFFHVVLWAFLPWSLWLYLAAGSRLAAWRKKTPSPWGNRELHPWGAALVTMLIFTASRSQLPHYLNIVFPFFSLVVAAWLVKLEKPRWAIWLGLTVTIGMPIATVGLLAIVQPDHFALAIAAVIALTAAGFFVFRGLDLEATLGRVFIAAVAINLALLHCYLPFLLKHQVGREAAELANTLPPMQTALVDVESRSFAFHLHGPEVVNWTSDDTVKTTASAPARVLMSASTKAGLEARGLTVKVLGTWDYFHVSMPTRTFLDARTRSTVVEPWVLAELSQ